MEREKLMGNGWMQKTVRIKDDYDIACTLIELSAKKNGLNVKKIFNEVFLSSLEYLFTNGFHYKIIPYEPRREPKGFLIENATLENIKDNFEPYKRLYLTKFNEKLIFAEFIELLIYIYCSNQLDKDVKELLNKMTINWGVENLKK